MTGTVQLKIDNLQWSIVDDFFEQAGWVGVSSGDIWIDEQPWGWYWAYWRPNLIEDLKIMVTCIDSNMQSILVAAFKVVIGSTHPIPISVDECPWKTDVSGLEPITLQEHEFFGKAIEIRQLLPNIIKNDPTLLKYLQLSDFSLNEISSKKDEYGWRYIDI